MLPNLFASIHTLFTKLPYLLDDLKAALAPHREQIPEIVAWVEGVSIDWSGVETAVETFFKDDSVRFSQMVDTIIASAFSVFGKIFSMFFALIIAFTALSQKERLARQAGTVLSAFVQPARAESISAYVRKVYRICSNFISGQVLAMLIFRFPHVLAISSLVMLLAFIPIVGAWVSGAVGAVMILATAGIGKALGFILMIVILQQIEGNIVYPRVMGKRVGLPSLWVLVAITLGSGALDAIGMLVTVPVFAVVYQLFKEAVEKRKKKRMAVPAET